MPSYLLNCECGQTLAVGAAQAGGQVVCGCGKTLNVPTLRMLRHSPQAEVKPPAAASAWNVRKGALTVCLILAGLLAAGAFWSRFTEPKLPEYDPGAHSRLVDQGLDKMTPAQAWQAWIQEYRPLAENGLAVLESPHTPAIRAAIAQKRFSQRVMLSLAAIFATGALVLALWRDR
jgi:hypothetical protein